jgi:hypothetical protein
MRDMLRLLALPAALAGALAVAPPAFAHPEDCSAGKATAGVFTFAATSFFGPGDDEGDHCFTARQIRRFDDSAATLAPGEVAKTKNMHHLANLPKSGPFAGESNFGSDIAFWGKYAIQGNYNGFQVTDISDPERPRIVSQVFCPGSQNDVSVWRNLIVLSTDSRRTDDSCNSQPAPNIAGSEYWEGIKVFDWSNPAAPKLVSAVETDCGSHTHTIIPEAKRLLVYVSSYDLSTFAKDCLLTSTPEDDHDKISIVEVPLSNPGASKVIAEPVLFPDGGNPGNEYTRQTRGCHDITVYPAIGLAAGACMGEGIIMDIRKPADPKVIASVRDENFAFWHSATFTHDAKRVLFTDELGGGGQPTCNPTLRDNQGANIFYDLSNPARPAFLSYFKIPRAQSNTENCVAHNGVFIPTDKGDTYVQAWYQGGTSVVDYNNPRKPREVGFFDRGPLSDARLILGGSWSSYFYNGFIWSNDIQQGLDVFKFSDPRGAAAQRQPYLNAQVQEPLRR